LEQLSILSKKDEPFYLQYWPIVPFTWIRSERDVAETRNGGSAAEDLIQVDKYVGEIMQELKTLGLEENTVVVVMGDNGPFLYGFQSKLGMSDMIYRGGKGDITEGGIRVNAFVRWPNVIKEHSYAGDMIHVMDLYSTFARIAGATKYIPTDRVIDGIDQTALLLEGETNGRRDYIYAYQTFRLAAIVKQKFKMHMPAPGIPGAAAPVYDLTRDPREENPMIEIALWSGASFQDMLKRHVMTMNKNPNAKIGKGKPYSGIENLRPETIETINTFMSWH
jgi:arylsulfatase